MEWLKNTGQYFLHEMMHTDLIGQPHITDEIFDPELPSSPKTYGSRLVHRLAKLALSKGGGATRASTNADSYAMLANCLWWWDVTGYFPLAKQRRQRGNELEVTAEDYEGMGPVSLYLDLGNITDTTAVDFDSLFADAIEGFSVPADTSSAPPDPAPAPSSAPAPQPSPAPAPAPAPESPMATENTCDVDYKFFFNRFEVEGRNFNAEKFGMDGSGLKEEISGCGAITDWSFERLTEPNSEFQWKAAGNLPIGTKACVGRAVISARGSDKDDCTGAG